MSRRSKCITAIALAVGLVLSLGPVRAQSQPVEFVPATVEPVDGRNVSVPLGPIEGRPADLVPVGPCLNNDRPRSVILGAQYAVVGELARFDGSESFDRDGSIVSYRWDFGDGNRATGRSVSHIFEAPGVYAITLEVIDDCGDSDIDLFIDTIGGGNNCSNNQAPIALGATDQPAEVFQVVEFDGTASRDSDGYITRYRWDYGDGGTSGWTTQPVRTHTYAQAGTYTASLRVMDNCYAISTPAMFTVNIHPLCGLNVPPVAHAGPDRSATVGQPVLCDASASVDADGNITHYFWNFGDNHFTGWITSPTVTHSFAASGAYIVTLWVRDSCGAISLSDSFSVQVTEPVPCSGNLFPAAVAEGDESGLIGETLTFSAGASSDPDGVIHSYHWNFGDGQTAVGRDVSHAYQATGLYLVTLTVVDDCGASSQDTLTVSITAPDPCAANVAPVANAGPDLHAMLGSPVVFDGSGSSDADGTVEGYWWVFGDGQSTGWQSSPTTSYFYALAGSYAAQLYVRDNCGAVSSADTTNVTIQADPCANNLPPTAILMVSHSNATVGQGIGFFSLFSLDPDGVIVNHHWSFGDGNVGSGSVVVYAYAASGTYQVTLTVTDNCGATSSRSAVVTVSGGNPCAGNVPPTASAGEDQETQAGQPVTFSAAGSQDANGNITSYTWDFGDGQFGMGLTTSHTYVQSGTYIVTLMVTDACEALASDTATVIVYDADPCSRNQAPIAAAGPDQNALTGAVIPFTATGSIDPDGTIVSYHWAFGDGQTAGGAVTSHAYAQPGSYVVTLTVTDDCGALATDVALVNVSAPDPCASNQAPLAHAGPDQQVNLGVPVVLSGSASTDADGTITSYWWNFDNGQFSGWLSSATVTHTYSAAGVYTVRLWVRDNCNSVSAEDTALITVVAPDPCAGNLPPVAQAVGGGTYPVGSPVPFIAFASYDPDGTIVNYAWTFGDGASGSGVVVSHIYTTPGSYTTILTVTDNCGATATKSIPVTINPPNPCQGNVVPSANAGPNQTGMTGQTIQFSSAGSNDPDGSITSYHWNFGNGQTALGATASHVYQNAGVYTVTLTVTDNCGATGQDTAIVTINAPDPCAGNHAPMANAGPDLSAHTHQSLFFSAASSVDSDGTIVSYHWNFGNGQTASGLSVIYVYTAPGVYNVTLTVTDNCGATAQDVAVATITVPDPCAGNQPPAANAGPDLAGEVGVPLTFSAAGSSDPDGLITAYWWNFGNGQATGWVPSPTVQHTYTTAGQFTATLWVRDNCGQSSSSDTAIVNIVNNDPCYGNQPPMAAVTGPAVAQVGQSVTFSGTNSTDPNNAIVSYHWTFGNGASASGPVASHVYTTPGQYNVVLTVTDQCGATDTESLVLNVLNANPGELNASFVASILVGMGPNGEIWQPIPLGPNHPIHVGTRVRFDASSSTGAAFYIWELAPGVIRTGAVQLFQYNTVGCYNISLTVYDAQGIHQDMEGGVLCVIDSMSFLDALPLADHNANDLAISNGIGWISHANNVLTAFNASNPNDLQLISATTAPTGRAIAAANGFVFLCSGTQGIHIYQATLPTPTLLGTYNTAPVDSQRAQDAVILGNVMYLAAGVAGVKVIDIRQSPTLIVVASTVLPNNTSADYIKVHNGRAYVADTTGKIYVYNVSSINIQNPQPGAITLQATIDNGWNVHHLSHNGAGLLAAYAPPLGLYLYDVSDPNNPNPPLLGLVDLATPAFGQHPGGILAVGSKVYVGYGNVLGIGTSVARLNIADPANAYFMEWLSMSGSISGSNRSPTLIGDVIYWTNSTYNAATVRISLP